MNNLQGNPIQGCEPVEKIKPEETKKQRGRQEGRDLTELPSDIPKDIGEKAASILNQSPNQEGTFPAVQNPEPFMWTITCERGS